VIANEKLSPVDEEGNLLLIPEEIIETRVKHLRSKEVREYLVKWKYLPIKDATGKVRRYYTNWDRNCLWVRNFQ
jgi:hypothetical protein